MRDEQRIQRATRPLEDGTAFNMWEIAEAFKLEWGIGRRSSCAGAAGLRSFARPQDDKLGGRTEGRGLPATSLQEGRKEGRKVEEKMDSPLPTTAGAGSTTCGDDVE